MKKTVLFLGLALAACDDGVPVVPLPPDGGPDMGVVQTDPPRRPPLVETCMTPLPAPPAGQACAVAAGQKRSLRISAGAVLLPDRVLRGGQVVVDEAGRIACAACDCAQDPAAEGASEVTCPEAVLSPGLVNSHDHITYNKAPPVTHGALRYDHRHEWRIGTAEKPKLTTPGGNNAQAVQWNELRHALAGATATLGAGGARGVLRNLDSAAEQQEGLFERPADSETFPLGDSSGKRLAMGCAYPSIRRTDELAALDAFVPHVSEGVTVEARNEFLCVSSKEGGGQDLLSPRTALVHGVALTAQDAQLLASRGTAVVWSPRSNIDLYGHTAPVAMLDRAGVLLALGTDWTYSGSMNLQRELRCADALNQRYYGAYFTDEDLWRMVTLNAAVVAGAVDALGQIRKGLVGDLALFRTAAGRADHRAVVAADPQDVLLVLRGGVPLLGDAALLDALGHDEAQGCEAVDVCGAARRVCAQRETGLKLAELEMKAGAPVYPLFFCAEPAAEPSCVPARPEEYSGAISTEDPDGDGLRGAADNCPKVFNPPRPLDGKQQPDTDRDGVGDACDACPLDRESPMCAAHPDPADQDRDQIADRDDNCPGFANRDQKDSDGDGVGDVCDGCPQFGSAAGEACPTTVRGVRDPMAEGRPRLGTRVALADVVVTAVRPQGGGYYVRDVMGAADYSGILIYTGGTAAPKAADGTVIAEGHLLSLSGVTADYRGQQELDSPRDVKVLGMMLVEPLDARPQDLLSSGERLESLLVRLQGVTMKRLVPPAPMKMEDDFYVSDDAMEGCEGDRPRCARVGDFLLDADKANMQPPFTQGGALQSVTGIVNGFGDIFSLEPRRAADIVP